MPGYKAFVQGYSGSQNLTLNLADGAVTVSPVQGSIFGPVDVDDPAEFAVALDSHLDMSSGMQLWPEDAEDAYPPEPAEVEPVTVPPMPQQNTDLPAPDDPAFMQGSGVIAPVEEEA